MQQSFVKLFFLSMSLVWFLFTTQVFAHTGAHDITLIYTGNLDGELEPCGCSEGGNKGGIKRRAKAIDELRKEDPALYLVSAGGLLISEIPQDKLKSDYILKGMAALNYDAIGVQWRDLAFGKTFLNKTSLPFIISNNPSSDFFSKGFINKKHVKMAFFNWLDPKRAPQKNMQDTLADNDKDKLLTAIKKAHDKKQLTLLSTTLSLKIAQRTFDLTNVDILIIKAKYERYSEPKMLTNTLVLQPGSRGMRIGKLNLAVTVEGEIENWKHTIIALPPETGDAERMQAWYDEYNAKVKQDYEKRVEIKKTLDKGESPYAGAAACKTCHAEQHKKWQTTRHSEAFYALQDANKAFDPNCIICHTVGFEKKGGFIDPSITEELLHVQCENCHGAASAHVKSAGQKSVENKGWPKEKICMQCHVQKHSPDFDLKKYWPKIAH